MTSEERPADKRQRIAKAMARAGLCSRRDAEAWIVAGRVSVNGGVITSPALDIGEADAVLVDGAPLPRPERTRLFLFHKPRGLVTTDHDPEGRETVAGFLAENWPEGPRIVTVGRLDINTEGLLLLTNDGGLARVLELPKTGWLRRYRVRAKGTADPAALDALAEGVTIDGIAYAGIEAKLDRVQGANAWLTMGLREGKNREIKKVLEHLGLEVNRLIRLSFGPFQLGDLPEGAVEEIRARVLRDQLGPSLAAEAGLDLGQSGPEANSAKPQGDRPSAPGRPARPQEGGRSARPREMVQDRRPEREPRRRDAERRSRDWSPGRGPERGEDRDAAPRRDRPAAGVRKHVSTLRAEQADTASGPRRRIARTDTRDRHDRAVAVERLVSTRPPPREERSPRGRHESPSALGKRQRIARSGGSGDRQADGQRRDDRRDDRARPPREPRGRPPEARREGRPPRRDLQREGSGRDDRRREGRQPRGGTDDRAAGPGASSRGAVAPRRPRSETGKPAGGRPPARSGKPAGNAGKRQAGPGRPRGPKAGAKTGPGSTKRPGPKTPRR